MKDDKTDFSNYKGISLLSITYKMLSNILLSKLTPNAEEIIGITSEDFDATCQLLIIKTSFYLKMCLNETYSTVQVGKHLPMSPIRDDMKQGDVLTPLIFNLAVEYTIRTVKVNQNCLKVNGTH